MDNYDSTINMRPMASELLHRAKEIIGGVQAPLDEIDTISQALLDQREFNYARRLLGRSRGRPTEDQTQRLRLAQRQALATYNDTELPANDRLEQALRILEERCNLNNAKNQETLGLAGSVFKRRWRLDGQKENLERALTYYLRGYEEGPEQDLGYTGVNAAFVLDTLAEVERREAKLAGGSSDAATARDEEARAIRQDLVETLTPMAAQEQYANHWWFLATLAEACFGLSDFEQAERWLKRAQQLDVPQWQFRSTVRQLATIARMQAGKVMQVSEFSNSGAGRVLRDFLGDHAEAVQGAFTGRVGLALSGGGFRAALFHIGVLAKLAELDVLRHVQVLSCVSGGAIVGTHYYLLLRQLLQNKSDANITRADYIELVHTLERDFLAGVQKNIRVRITSELVTNLKLMRPGYTRTMRMGELYEKHLFSRVKDGYRSEYPWWQFWKVAPRWFNDLLITPKGEDPRAFSIKHDNWRRCAKVPELIINATTLNTGHNWQFTATWMGEPPGAINSSVDGNYQLRRMYYWEAPPKHRRVRLGYAVAASACVPGAYEPMQLDDLYPGIDVRLVDGGVYDNQGMTALHEHDCQVVLVSDASGQMGTDDHPGDTPIGVPMRANAILQSRVRRAQYESLEARQRSGLLRGLMMLHLRQGLGVEPRDWVGCQDPVSVDEERPPGVGDALTSYSIPVPVQRRLAALRTDLDSFSDAEAFSLMSSGYRMVEGQFRDNASLTSLTKGRTRQEDWRFLQIEQAMQPDSPAYERLLSVLDVGRNRNFKVWRLSPEMKKVGLGLAGVGITLLLGLAWIAANVTLVTVGGLALLTLLSVVALSVGRHLMDRQGLRFSIRKSAMGLALAIVGPIFGRLHLAVFDQWFLREGKLGSLSRPEASVAAPAQVAGEPAVDGSDGDTDAPTSSENTQSVPAASTAAQAGELGSPIAAEANDSVRV